MSSVKLIAHLRESFDGLENLFSKNDHFADFCANMARNRKTVYLRKTNTYVKISIG